MKFINGADFLHADCGTIILVGPDSCSIFLTFKWQSTAVVLVGPLVVARRVLLCNRIYQSFRPAVGLSVFLELDHQISLNFSMMLKTLMEFCVTKWGFLEKHFQHQKLGKWAKLIENFLIEHGQKWVRPIWFLDSKVDRILRMNRWNQLIFCVLLQIHEN